MTAIAALAGFLLGITIESSLSLSLGIPAALAALLAAASLFLYLAKRNRRACLLAAAFLVAAALGIARTALASRELPAPFSPYVGTHVSFEGRVVADPDVRETTARLTILIRDGDASTRVLAVAPLYPSARYGETVRLEGMLELPEPFATDSGRTFRYDRFLAKDGVFALVSNASVEVIAPRAGVIDAIFGALSDLKAAGLRALSAALPEPQASLAGGLILGGKQGLGEGLLDDFIRAGLVHIVVLSGYNVMIVAEAALRALGFLGKRAAASAATAVIALFVLASGAGAASVRAGLMAGVALYGRASGRTYDALRALIAAGAFMLLWNPLLLLDDPGFQLSFVATLGLIFGAPITERWLSFVRIKFLREVLSATVAAQVAVLPLLLFSNGLFSLIALPANALVLPVVPLAMALSGVAMVAGFLFPAAAPFFGLPAYALLSYMIGLVESFAALPLAVFTVPAFPFALVIAAYAFLAWFAWKGRQPTSPGPKSASPGYPSSRSRGTPRHTTSSPQGRSRP